MGRGSRVRCFRLDPRSAFRAPRFLTPSNGISRHLTVSNAKKFSCRTGSTRSSLGVAPCSPCLNPLSLNGTDPIVPYGHQRTLNVRNCRLSKNPPRLALTPVAQVGNLPYRRLAVGTRA
jgi:hypothetical protein